ncbi:MAG TPA: sigma-54 dependent transcriptional regulator [Vineibacter sp.]|nr:sigma-54 dependent transcriptional regulator [Vineibacter sp.]
MACILIVDDDRAFRDGLAETVASLGHDVHAVASAGAARRVLDEEDIDLVLVDFRMPDIDGLAFLRTLDEKLRAATPIVMLTAYADSANTIEAMRLGAFDHLTKPIGRDAVIAVIARALARVGDTSAAPQEVATPASFVGASDAIREVQKRIGLAAAHNSTVLITGETGTGKELVARALHFASDRRNAPIVAVNCAAIPAELLESELFGHVRGAFSGALSDRVGRFEAAHTGTLFLDEIGDMSPALQAKILRVLQEQEVTRVGARLTTKVDVRVIAATHRDLPAMVANDQFRQDLLYRLRVVPIHVPPLRARLADIVPLADHFLALHGGRKQLSPAAAERLIAHSWPGNVRELRNAMERVAVLVRGTVIEAQDLDFLAEEIGGGSDGDWLSGDLSGAVARLEIAMIRKALMSAQGNRAEAARRLGIHRQLLYSKLKQYGID